MTFRTSTSNLQLMALVIDLERRARQEVDVLLVGNKGTCSTDRKKTQNFGLI